MFILTFRYILLAFQLIVNILVLEKLNEFDIYIYGVFQTVVSSLIYLQIGLPQGLLKISIATTTKERINYLKNFLSQQWSLFLFLIPGGILIIQFILNNWIFSVTMVISVCSIALLNIISTYLRLENKINLWLLSLNIYSIITLLYLLVFSEKTGIQGLFFAIFLFNISILKYFYKRLNLGGLREKISSKKILSISSSQLLMNIGAGFLIVINRYQALTLDEVGFKFYQETYVVLAILGVTINSIFQLASPIILKSLITRDDKVFSKITQNIYHLLVLGILCGYALSYYIDHKYTIIFRTNIIISFAFLMPSIVLIFHNFLISKNFEKFGFLPLIFSCITYIIQGLGDPLNYLIISSCIFYTSYVVIVFALGESEERKSMLRIMVYYHLPLLLLIYGLSQYESIFLPFALTVCIVYYFVNKKTFIDVVRFLINPNAFNI